MPLSIINSCCSGNISSTCYEIDIIAVAISVKTPAVISFCNYSLPSSVKFICLYPSFYRHCIGKIVSALIRNFYKVVVSCERHTLSRCFIHIISIHIKITNKPIAVSFVTAHCLIKKHTFIIILNSHIWLICRNIAYIYLY